MALLGLGTVGRAFLRHLADLAGEPLVASWQLVAVAHRGGVVTGRGGALDAARILEEKQAGTLRGEPIPLESIVDSVDVHPDIIVDAIPSDLVHAEPSTAVARAALQGGRTVVFANKGPLALHGPALTAEAAQSGGAIYASAAVCAGTPVLETLESAFRGDRLVRFEAVLNGSTNFLLSRMENGASFEESFTEARGEGILEADPFLDIGGSDAAAKAVIVANHAWGHRWTLPDAAVRGITGISASEAQEARQKGMALRLVARGDPVKGISVAPLALPREHPLVVPCRENVVRLKYARAGAIVLRGPGAGGAETAAALISDVWRATDARKWESDVSRGPTSALGEPAFAAAP